MPNSTTFTPNFTSDKRVQNLKKMHTSKEYDPTSSLSFLQEGTCAKNMTELKCVIIIEVLRVVKLSL
jgi:hypothetical protein